MSDILVDETPCWQFVEQSVQRVLSSYGYGEVRLPIVEKTALFLRSIGEVTDIVEKEMYSFDDRNGDGMTLRPEGTAGCVRAAVQHSLLNTPQKLWYCGPMFRYERPQKGRQRQFHQVGVEAFGVATPDIDAELIILTARLWRELGIAENVTLELNSIGNAQARERYRNDLVAYLQARHDELDEDSQRRLLSNPLRILDSKNVQTQALLDGAPCLSDYLDEESQHDFARLCEMLQWANVPFVVNRRLVRGLDYYNKTVFEWVTDQLGAQGTICGGGRYDGLVEQLGGKATPAVGFAMGMERLVLMLQADKDAVPKTAPVTHVYVVAVGEDAQRSALLATEALREQQPDWRMIRHHGGGSFKSQMKKADKSGAQVALIWGEDEVAAQTVTLKTLRAVSDDERGAQQTIPVADLEATLTAVLTP